jgi:hypothetical protein
MDARTGVRAAEYASEPEYRPRLPYISFIQRIVGAAVLAFTSIFGHIRDYDLAIIISRARTLPSRRIRDASSRLKPVIRTLRRSFPILRGLRTRQNEGAKPPSLGDDVTSSREKRAGRARWRTIDTLTRAERRAIAPS